MMLIDVIGAETSLVEILRRCAPQDDGVKAIRACFLE
jgi:hypothetical protein